MANIQSIEEYEIENPHGIELSDGEVICPKCKGTSTRFGEGLDAFSSCDRCWGEGKLDWIDLIMGKEQPFALSGMSSSSSRSRSSSTRQTMKKENLNGNNNKPELRELHGLSKMFNKSKGSLQRRGHKIRRRKTEK